jgi:hypothetical protein
MQADYSRFLPYVIAVVVVWAIYRRLRRSFGQQPLRPVRMRMRMGILLLLGVSFIPVALKSVQFFGAEVAGLVAGIALALWGASRTRYRSEGDQLYYVPHTYTGIVVSLLFIGRLAYRLAQAYLWNAAPVSAHGYRARDDQPRNEHEKPTDGGPRVRGDWLLRGVLRRGAVEGQPHQPGRSRGRYDPDKHRGG